MQKTKRKFSFEQGCTTHSPDEIIMIRNQILQISQALFANLLGVSKQTINSWESGWRTPSPMAVRFLSFAKKYPETILREIKYTGGKNE